MNISDITSTNCIPLAANDETLKVIGQSELCDYKINEKQQRSLTIIHYENVDYQAIENQLSIDASNIGAATKTATAMAPKKQIANIARTITNSHPLMLSPSGTDSDPEEFTLHNPNHGDKQANFPDVIPRSEHQHAIISCKMNNIAAVATPPQTPQHNKLALLRTHSPDLLSSESEADLSQYHAAVEANFQTVVLLPKHNNHNHNNNNQQINNNNNNNNNNNVINGMQEHHVQLQQREDISSLDSISNHSFDNEPNLASLSPSSSVLDIDALNDNEDHVVEDDVDNIDIDLTEIPTTIAHNMVNNMDMKTSPITNTLPQYSAHEERRDVRNWQKITLPNGSTREIDMRVIEPYKRVLSHGGYLKAGGHNAIVLFSACHLPDRSRTDYSYVMDNLFLYVVKTLEQLVTEDYVLVYLHGGSDRRSVPPFPWLKKCYQLIDRRLRKSLKNLYLVHPTFWLKSIVWMARPFVSTKFWRKLVYVKSLDELGTHVAVEKAAIPEKVKQFDAKHC